MAEIVVNPDDLVTSTMLADELGLTRPQVANWIKRHEGFPAPVLAVGPNVRLYSRKACHQWIRAYLTEQVLPATKILGAMEGDSE